MQLSNWTLDVSDSLLYCLEELSTLQPRAKYGRYGLESAAAYCLDTSRSPTFGITVDAYI